MCELNILITAASRRVPLIRAFSDALRRLGLKGRVITTDMNRLSPGLYFSDGHYIVPLTTHEQYIPIIRSICFKERVHLLVPTIDDELPLFGRYADNFLATGVRVVVSPEETGTICNDKHQTYRFMRDRGLPFVQTWLPGELDISNLPYPLFLKPRTGRGSVGAHPVNNERELRFFLEYVPDPVVQAYLPGREFTLDVLCDFSGRAISVVPRERLVIRSGVSDRGRTWNNPALIDMGAQAATALGVRGPANIQVKLQGDAITIFEVNPRFSGGIPLTLAAGADFPGWLIELRCGRKLKPCLGRFKDGLVMACYESAIFLHGGESPAAEEEPIEAYKAVPSGIASRTSLPARVLQQ
jgi:carbamoyl-phosphate synthase large subunit